MNDTTREVGSALGIALLGSILGAGLGLAALGALLATFNVFLMYTGARRAEYAVVGEAAASPVAH